MTFHSTWFPRLSASPFPVVPLEWVLRSQRLWRVKWLMDWESRSSSSRRPNAESRRQPTTSSYNSTSFGPRQNCACGKKRGRWVENKVIRPKSRASVFSERFGQTDIQTDTDRQTDRHTNFQNDLRISVFHLPVPSLVLKNVKNAKECIKNDFMTDGPTDRHSGL